MIKFHSLFENEGADRGMADLFTQQGWESVGYENADIIVFNGGADIGTSIYGEKPISRGIPEHPSPRDKQEIEIYNKYKGSGKLLLGICRGAQLLNCLNGGKLWQDVDCHESSHHMTILATGHKLWVTSTHHQMMRPNLETGKVLAIADCSKNKHADHADWSPNGGVFYPDDHRDTEIVWYPHTGSLCIQGHPEYVPGSEFSTFCLDMISHYLEEVKLCVA